jgi:ribose transport system ATP-binding protein
VRVAHLSKTFPGQTALDNVEFEVSPGEVHALVGPNGSGKSTLVKVLTGFHSPDPGAEIWIRGEPARFGLLQHETESGRTLTVRAVHQDFGLIGGLNAIDNIALGSGYVTRHGRVRWKDQREQTRLLLGRFGAAGVDLDRPLDQCDPLHRTQIAIARVLASWGDADGLLILDEPTAALPEGEVRKLFHIVREVRASGVSVIYVSHRFREVFEVSDRVTVLREARVVRTCATSELDHDQLVFLVAGPSKPSIPTGRPRQTDRAQPRSTRELMPPQTLTSLSAVPPATVPLLSASGLISDELRGLDFTLQPGEILGFAGLIGSGQEELPYVLSGAKRARAGLLRLGDSSVPAAKLRPALATQLGIGLVPANRATEGLIPKFSILQNMTLPRLSIFQRRGVLRSQRERRYVWERMEHFGVVPRDPDRIVQTLSGGNQQKIVLAKWLGLLTKVLVMAEPTAGVDVATRPVIYDLIREQASQGLGVIVCSTDLLELEQLCTRVIVLRDGAAIDTFAGEEITEERILRATLGGAA